MIESYAISEIGGRSENQDRTVADHSLGLFAVADGMGGHRGGSVAAELAISTLRYYVDSSQDRFDVSWPFGYSFDLSVDANRLCTGIHLANRHVCRQAETSPSFAGMGTTVAALLLNDATAVIGNVGDSRIYLLRGGRLEQLTKDDTIDQAALGIALGADASRMRHVLAQAIGSTESVDVHVCEKTLLSDDLVLISSDGLHGAVEDSVIESILRQADMGIQRLAESLVEAASGQNAADNVSVVLLAYNR